MNSQKERFYFKRPEVIQKTEKAKKEKGQYDFRFLKNFFYLACLMFLMYYAIFSDTFKIKNVEVTGVKSTEISDHLNRTLIGKNILIMRTGKYLNDLAKSFPILEEASLVRGLPSTIKISIKERSQVLILCNLSSCWEVDSQGYAYQKIEKPLDKVVLNDDRNREIKDTDRLFSDSFIKFYLDAIDSMNTIGVHVKEARMDETSYKINFQTAEGWAAVMDSSASLENQISAIKQVVEKNKPDVHEYIDVRVEGVAYLK